MKSVVKKVATFFIRAIRSALASKPICVQIKIGNFIKIDNFNKSGFSGSLCIMVIAFLAYIILCTDTRFLKIGQSQDSSIPQSEVPDNKEISSPPCVSVGNETFLCGEVDE